MFNKANIIRRSILPYNSRRMFSKKDGYFTKLYDEWTGGERYTHETPEEIKYK